MKKQPAFTLKRILTLVLTLSLAFSVFMMTGCMPTNERDTNKLVLGVRSNLGSFDVAKGQNSLDFIIRRCLYDPLVHVDPVTGEEFMRLAEKYTKSDDGLTYTFYLRKDVKMHDGSGLTAKDVVFSLNLTKESADVSKNLSAMKSAKALDDYTVEVSLDAPYAAFMKGISMVFILSAQAYETLGSNDFSKAPVGCGPYQFVSYENENKITLKAFADYYRGAAPIENVEIRQFADENAMAIALESGELDCAAAISTTSYANLSTNPDLVINQIQTTKYGLLSMNTTVAPFDNKLVRQAINYAINRKFILDSCRSGIGKTSSLLFNSVLSCTEGVEEYTYDPDKAIALLEEAGITLPLKLDAKISTMSSTKVVAEAIQSCLKEIGIEMEIEVLEAGAFFEGALSGKVVLGVANLGTSAVDADQYYNCISEAGLTSLNFARYVNPEVDALMLQARTIADQKERDAAYRQILEMIQEDAPYAILYEMVDLEASVKGLNVNWGLNGMFYLYDFSWDE